jgi:hypothetical protein
MHLTGLMNRARAEKNAFGQSRLARVATRGDTEISGLFDRDIAFHGEVGLGSVHGHSWLFVCWILVRASRERSPEWKPPRSAEASGSEQLAPCLQRNS